MIRLFEVKKSTPDHKELILRSPLYLIHSSVILHKRLAMPVMEKFNSNAIKWIDVTDPTAQEMETLSNQYHLNQHTVKDCMQPEHLPKYEFDEDRQVHFLILRYYTPSPDSASSIQQLTNKIAIFFTEETLITIHKEDTPFLETIAKKATKAFSTTTELLSRIAWHALETFDDPANQLSEQLEAYESRVMLKETSGDVTEALFYIKRHAAIAHKVLMLMLEPIHYIKVGAEGGPFIQDVRDQHLKMQTLYNQILEDVNNLLSFSTSFAAQRTNEVVRILTLFSVFFMPLTFIVGIYGMNFDFMPELRQRWGYPAALLLMAVVTLVIYLWFKRKKWL